MKVQFVLGVGLWGALPPELDFAGRFVFFIIVGIVLVSPRDTPAAVPSAVGGISFLATNGAFF